VRKKTCPVAQRVLFYLTTIISLLLVGCSKTPDEWLQRAVAAEKAAQSALSRNDPKAARRAADDAGKAARQLQKLAEADGPSREERQRLFQQAQVAARLAREHAGLALERRQRQDKLSGLKVRTYQKARSLIFTTVLPPMAAAAGKAAKVGTNELTAIERPLAQHSWKLASILCARPQLSDGAPDWAGAASDLRSWSTNQTLEFKAFLALVFVMLGQSDFALAELESVDPANLQSTNALAIYHGGRALLYALQGWNQLAAPEAEAFEKQAQIIDGPVNGQQLVAMFHAFTACDAFTKRDFLKMDAAVAQSIRAWPDNPLAAYLTGEKLAANGEWEKAAVSLEARAAGTEDEWIAQRLAQRARDLRDGKGTTKALVLDTRFLAQLAVHATVKTARNSAAGKRLGEFVEGAKTFGQQLRERVPLLGGAGAEKSSSDTSR